MTAGWPGPGGPLARRRRAFVDALARARSVPVGPPGWRPTGPWLARDPELTQPGPRPTVQPDSGDLAEPALPRRRGRRLAVLAVVGLLALAVGGGAGYAAQRSGRRPSAPSRTPRARCR